MLGGSTVHLIMIQETFLQFGDSEVTVEGPPLPKFQAYPVIDA